MDIREPNESSQDTDTVSESNRQQQMSADNSQSSHTESGSSVFGTVLLVIGLLIIVAAGVYFYGNFSSGIGGGTGPVARVAGEPIERSAFQQQLSSLRQSTSSRAQQFQALSNTRQKELVLAGLINRELLQQAAKRSGVSVTKSEVNKQLQQQIQQLGGSSAFQKRLQQNNLTRKQIRKNLKQQLLVNKYVSEAAGTSTDKQVKRLYDQYTARLRQQSGTSTPQIPSLKQLRPQLEATIQQQVQQQLLRQARKNLNVEVLIDGVDYPPTSQQQSQQSSNGQPSSNQQTQQSGNQQTSNTNGSGSANGQ